MKKADRIAEGDDLGASGRLFGLGSWSRTRGDKKGGIGVTNEAVAAPTRGKLRVPEEYHQQVYFWNSTNLLGQPLRVEIQASLLFVVVSARKHEPAWRSVTFALLIFYVMLQFALT